MTALTAGAALADITPPVGVFLDGYGGRLSPSQGVHDPLFARCLVASDAQTTIAVVSCDLLGLHSQMVAWARQAAAAMTPIPPENILIAAIHTHAGPFGLRGGMLSRLDEELAQVTARKIAGGIAAAHRGQRDAVLKVGQGEVTSVSQNRRHPDWPIDPALRLLLLDATNEEPAARPIAAVLSFACHATILNWDNLLISADYPGRAATMVQEAIGAPCLFLQGACGNVNPTWVRQDFDSVERVGSIIGAEAIKLANELRPLGQGQRAHNIRWDEHTEKPVTAGVLIPQPRLAAARRELTLPAREFLSAEEYRARIQEQQQRIEELNPSPPPDERRRLAAELTRLEAEQWVGAWARGRDLKEQRTELQALAFAPGLVVLGLPGEFFVETALALQQVADVPHLLVACYANDYVGYVIPADAYDQGGYEAGITLCQPHCEGMIRETALDLLGEVCPGMRGG